jgi:GT2 family glycosyltransferase
MVGLPEHVAFRRPGAGSSVEERVRAGVSACAATRRSCATPWATSPHVRWHGRRRIQEFIRRLYRAAKEEDPEGLVTYVNYPTTEYLELPFLDLACFNVYLESQDRLEAYLARLHNLVGDKPLIMAEIGLDSRRHGEGTQARVLDWQVTTTFATGCAGAFVFAWTDEWHRGGYDIEDWDFGLTDRRRQPKPALATVSRVFEEVPSPKSKQWPRISVVVCSYNGARTIRECLGALLRLESPDFEVIVVDDGSRDGTAAIAHEYGVRLIRTENRGLSSARNTGLAAATGEIVAYIDDDAYPDPHWLIYLAATFERRDVVGVGGPNIAPPGDGPIAECVANAPGGPIHVLLTDTEAEHLPGCNMAFRKSALEAVGGFDPRFRTAGDDVDVCWRLQERGYSIGFNPAAVVWHHRRNSVRAYWKQQVGYGRAEALLERKWPEKYNAAGHLTWAGRLYGRGRTATLRLRRGRVYQGIWGSAPFQSVYEPAPGLLGSLPFMPEWYLFVLGLAGLSALGALWPPLRWALPLFVLALVTPAVQAILTSTRVSFPSASRSRAARFGLRLLTAALHLLQPLARLTGRLAHGLTPWRRRGQRHLSVPGLRQFSIWSEQWREPNAWVASVEAALRAERAILGRGGEYDRWDVEVRGGALASVRLLVAIEEHGTGRQLVRIRVWPRWSRGALALLGVGAALTVGAALERAWGASVALGVTPLLLSLCMVEQAAGAGGAVSRALSRLARHPLACWTPSSIV